MGVDDLVSALMHARRNTVTVYMKQYRTWRLGLYQRQDQQTEA